ncbi:ABC transporter permease subunit [Gottfriedia acidiceleris]|uniref:ABC transporter permease subunit n=1 Tax=Bacillaceae TaxID=186817 RepID=UPI000BEBA5A3|nr:MULTISPECIES: ABC transporter permease subunit [unclassified Bacillus (in: firmicutes)]PEC49522.1 ABC transporter permease [Bacillus sp. AFS096315]PFM81738.1 ABC transporter permease [Bacillus sp. AFS077874]
MNIFLHELKAYRKSTFIWTASLMAIVVFFLSLFPAIAKDYVQFSKVLEGYPEGVRKALGLEIESFGNVLGFYSYVFIYISLCGAIQAMILGTSIISKEVREKTADFLLTKPVTRTKVMTSKIFAGVVSLAITNVFYLVATIMMAQHVKTADYSSKSIILLSVSLYITQLLFFGIGILVSVVFPKIKVVLSISLAIVFGFFVVGMVVATDESNAKRFLSPFKYFEPKYIIAHSKFESNFLFASIGIILVSIIVSYMIYKKRDIHAV